MIKNSFISLAVFIVLLLLWEGAALYGTGIKFILPAPSRVFLTIGEHGDRFIFHTLATLREMSGGLLLASLIAFPLAWMMTYFVTLRAILQPIFILTQSVPMIALAPLMVFWFGWGYTAIIVPTALMIFFPLTMNIYQGFCAAPANMVEFFRLHDATLWQKFCKLQLPWALPNIFTGLRIGVAYAGIGAVAGEWAGGQHGLGILMLESRRAADLEMMFGALVCVTLLSFSFYGLALFVESMVLQKRFITPSIRSSSFGIALISLLAGGCAGPNENASLDKETTLVLDWLPNPNHVPLYAGISRGYFSERGIDLKILKIAEPSDNIPYVTSGQASLCLSYTSSTLLALSNNMPILPVGVLIDKPLNAFIYRQGNGIQSPEDLAGKVVGYCVDGYHTRYLEAILANRKIATKDLCNASFDLVGMLATGQVDAIFGAYWNIEGENLRSHGIEINYFPLTDFGVPTHYELIFIAKEGSPESREEFIGAFQTAMQNSIDYSIKNPDEAFDIYLAANPDKSSKTREWERGAWIKTLPMLADRQNIDPTVWNNFVQWLKEKQLL